jgi:hypothetical protein
MVLKMTNTTLVFDTLQYAKKLQKAGVPEPQAEVQAEAFKEQNVAINNWIDNNLATKQDLKLEIELVRRDIEVMKRDIIIKLVSLLGSIIVGCFGILGALIVTFHK